MTKQEAVEQFLEGQAAMFAAGSLPPELGSGGAAVFADIDGVEIAEFLAAHILAAQSLNALVFQPTANQRLLREWLKTNGFIIYGEELTKEGEAFCETFAAAPDDKATEEQRAKYERSLRMEVYIAGTYDLFNEIPVILYETQNLLFPEFLRHKIHSTAQEINRINDIELYHKAMTPELEESRRLARVRLNELELMRKTMYPYE